MNYCRTEINLRRLLAKCELLVKHKEQKNDEKFTTYVHSLTEMLTELRELPEASDKLGDYAQRISILNKIVNNGDISPRSEREQLFGNKNNLRLRQTKTDDLDEILQHHNTIQDKITTDMLHLTRNLKEQSILANKIIKQDTDVMGKSTQLTEKNFIKLKSESEKLAEHSRRACKCWMWIMLVVVMVLFINMVLFMKVMKKKIV